MFRRFAALIVIAAFPAACGGESGNGGGAAPTPLPLPRAIQIVTELTATGIPSGPTTVGQSVTFAGGPFDTLRFRFLVPSRGEPAKGALFLLTREYLGSQYDLGPQTPGFLASTSRIEDGEWVFDPALRINGGSTYWFMANSEGDVFSTKGDQDLYPGGDVYTSGFSGPFMRFLPSGPNDRTDALFQLRGSLVTP